MRRGYLVLLLVLGLLFLQSCGGGGDPFEEFLKGIPGAARMSISGSLDQTGISSLKAIMTVPSGAQVSLVYGNAGGSKSTQSGYKAISATDGSFDFTDMPVRSDYWIRVKLSDGTIFDVQYARNVDGTVDISFSLSGTTYTVNYTYKDTSGNTLATGSGTVTQGTTNGEVVHGGGAGG